MNNRFLQRISKALEDAKLEGRYKNYPQVGSAQGALITINTKSKINLASNNYLGLASEPRVIAAAKNACDRYGVGTASVRALVGTNDLHLKLEQNLANFKNCDSAIVLTSGYLANMAVIQTFVGKDDIVISDSLNHASIIDAIRLSGVKNKIVYPHADWQFLDSKKSEIEALSIELQKENQNGGNIFIVTDGVFSMDGDIAPLPELVRIKNELGATLIVDDAHGEGVLGKNGKGVVDHFQLHGQVEIEVGTLSKAFGVLGGFICGQWSMVEYLRQNARQFLFTNALSVPDTAALIEGLAIMETDDTLLKNLHSNANFLKSTLKSMGFDTGNSSTPITPIMIGDEAKTRALFQKLLDHDVLTTAIVFPMVPIGTARLRLIPSALHSQKDLQIACDTIALCAKELGVLQ